VSTFSGEESSPIDPAPGESFLMYMKGGKYVAYLIICSIIAINCPAYGEVDLKSVHPDESAASAYNERFSSKRHWKAWPQLSLIGIALENSQR